jgi:putative ATP-binding cassette transporter
MILLLLRSSWLIVLFAGLTGAISGVASVALIAIIHQTLQRPGAATVEYAWPFAGICLIVLLTRIASQVALTRLAQNSISKLCLGLCRRILEAPLVRLEEIGSHRLLASLTGDVGMISTAMNGVPVLCVNIVILLCGASYLGWMSPTLLVGAILLTILGLASYVFTSRFAKFYLRGGREAQDVLMKNLRALTDGVSHLKVHHYRRQEFVDRVLTQANAEVRENHFAGASILAAAVSWGRLLFMVAIGLLLFAWPHVQAVDAATLTGYTLTILYLMSPLERIMAWLPLMDRAAVSIRKIERLGLMLEQVEPTEREPQPMTQWNQIQLVGATHAYHRERDGHGFVLGPIDLTVYRGEIVFIVGGNGSGKTTLVKLITGLYVPQSGELRVESEAISADRIEDYRQLFTVVFSDPVIFDSLLGMNAQQLDERAEHYLRRLELDHKVTVSEGVFSTTDLSRGQRKRLALLVAYLEDRPIYVFDEWAADQDPAFKQVFYRDILPDLKRRGKTVVAVTHDDRYFSTADRVVKLEDGKLADIPEDALQESLIEGA